MSANLLLRQASLPGLCPITAAVEALAGAVGAQERGAVFTRREVVEFILDLAGYTEDRPLTQRRLLEPSFGHGDFLLPAVERLLRAWKAGGETAQPLELLGGCIRAVELHRESFATTRAALLTVLKNAGLAARTACALADRWLQQGDFLLAELPGSFDWVVGNPPYVRTELIPDVLMAEYRRRYTTIYDRADLYIPFLERSLRSLAPGGTLGFICADRWTKNRYGGPLRALVAKEFHLKSYVDMTGTPAFQREVIAYPAVMVITRGKPGATRVAHRPRLERDHLAALAALLTARQPPPAETGVKELHGVAAGAEPWLLEASDQMTLLRRLEQSLPTLEEVGCKVGIGVATGADSAYIDLMEQLDVEPDRKLPLVMTRDITGGSVQWRGYGVINPFDEAGGLVDLKAYPRLRRYLHARKAEIAARHCARKSPASWYRTIDRITPALAARPKLLIPDIKGEAHIVYEEGRLYPHHNLYYVISDHWALRALQAVLLSEVARLFIATYSTRMRGGYLRFQAQYLRRIRLPRWEDVPGHLRQALAAAAAKRDIAACNRAAFELYGLSPQERSALGGVEENDA